MADNGIDGGAGASETPQPAPATEDALTAGVAPGYTVATAAPSISASQDIAPQTEIVATEHGTDEQPRVSGWFITGLAFATFGVMMALILPTAFSLSVVLDRIAPGREEILGGIVSASALAGMLAGPAIGVWSDRTRSRFGRRRPFLFGGLVVGLAGLVIVGTADHVALLYVGWFIGNWGLGTVASALVNVQADRLPESQRGRVAGLTGFATMAAPILGMGLAYSVVGNQLLLFVVPGVIAALFVVLFGILMKDPDTRGKRLAPLSFGAVASKYVFDPRKHAPYAWNWLGRLIYFLAISGTTTYTAFFFAQRLGLPVREAAGVVATVSLIGIVGGIVGGLGTGFLSDKFKRRRIFVVIAVVLIAAGSIIVGLADGMGALIVGMLVMNLGIGSFSAVDQAIVLDVLPERDTDAGRYMALMNFSQGIPNVIAPLVAAWAITIGATGDEKNYTLLYFVAAGFAIIGGLVIVTKVKGIR